MFYICLYIPMKLKRSQENLGIKKANIRSVRELINLTNTQLDDALYITEDIFIPQKKDIKRCYRTDFELKTQKEAKKIMSEKKIFLSSKHKHADFFVYNERKEELLPFKKNDYLMHDHGYFTFDGKNYVSYDDSGREVGRFSFLEDIKKVA